MSGFCSLIYLAASINCFLQFLKLLKPIGVLVCQKENSAIITDISDSNSSVEVDESSTPNRVLDDILSWDDIGTLLTSVSLVPLVESLPISIVVTILVE